MIIALIIARCGPWALVSRVPEARHCGGRHEAPVLKTPRQDPFFPDNSLHIDNVKAL